MDPQRYAEAVQLLRHIAEATCMDSKRFLFADGSLIKAAVICFLYEIGEAEYRDRKNPFANGYPRALWLKEKTCNVDLPSSS